MRRTAFAAMGVTAFVLAGCSGSDSRTSIGSSSAPTMPQLRDMEQLRAKFNGNVGVPRLVVLISPT